MIPNPQFCVYLYYLKQNNGIDGDGVIGVSAITTTLCLYPYYLLYLSTMPLNTN
jgi:hypothetical protein